jgi:hypothetical protein
VLHPPGPGVEKNSPGLIGFNIFYILYYYIPIFTFASGNNIEVWKLVTTEMILVHPILTNGI